MKASANIKGGRLTDQARIAERVIRIHERLLRITQCPQSVCPPAQDCHPLVFPKSGRQRTMLGGIVKGKRLIEMLSGSPGISCAQ